MGCKHQFIAALLAIAFPLQAAGQEAGRDTLRTGGTESESYKFEWRQTVLPASLIAAGAVCLAPSFVRNGSRAVTNGVIDIRGQSRKLEFDDYVQYAPVVGALALGCAGVKARHTVASAAAQGQERLSLGFRPHPDSHAPWRRLLRLLGRVSFLINNRPAFSNARSGAGDFILSTAALPPIYRGIPLRGCQRWGIWRAMISTAA